MTIYIELQSSRVINIQPVGSTAVGLALSLVASAKSLAIGQVGLSASVVEGSSTVALASVR